MHRRAVVTPSIAVDTEGCDRPGENATINTQIMLKICSQAMQHHYSHIINHQGTSKVLIFMGGTEASVSPCCLVWTSSRGALVSSEAWDDVCHPFYDPILRCENPMVGFCTDLYHAVWQTHVGSALIGRLASLELPFLWMQAWHYISHHLLE